ncbi:MAG: type II secretion system F family protein [Clostridia bacterium]|nr:type II secretion system F family protein [Clostridia bacterium]
MQQYKYTAVNLQKEKFSGTFIAQDERDLAAQLAKQNLFLVSCSLYSGKTPSAFFTTGTGKVPLQELTTFCSQFSIMLTAGISILEALDSLKEQSFSSFFHNLLVMIYDDVKSGIMLSEALNKHKKVFPDFFRSMVYVGEAGGKLEMVFKSLSEYYEKDNAIKRKTKSAFSYPIMLGCMTVGIVILMLLFIVPTFRETLNDLDVEIQGLTAVIFKLSDFMIAYWLYILAIICVLGIAIVVFAQTDYGSRLIDKLKIEMPIIRKIQIDLITSRFARGFALLLSSGMDIVEALDTVSIVIGNQNVAARFKKATEEVKHGTSLSVAFEKQNIFPQILLQMIAVGEKTATLGDVLNRSCSYFDDQVDATLSSVTSKIQPVMLILMGGIIGVLFIAIYSPMISIMTSLV